MKKLLVTGASGFLGWNVSNFPQNEWKLIGTYFTNKKGIKRGLNSIQLDLTNRESTWRVIKEIKPDAILHLAAASSTNFCEKNPDISYQINVNATQYLTEFCFNKYIPFLFTSSGQVFDGLSDSYDDNDKPNPQNIYGKQKLESEKFILKNSPKSIICRVPVMYGIPSPISQNFANNWINNWKRGESITAFYDEYRSFLSGQKAAEALFLLLNKNESGIFNVGGKEKLNRVEFAKQMKKVLKFDDSVIIEKSQKEVMMSAYRPPKVVFKSLKIKELGFEQGSLEEELIKAFLK